MKYISAIFFAFSILTIATIEQRILAQVFPDEQESTIQLRVLYMRHGFSCANASILWTLQFKDPLLTDCGIWRSYKSGQSLIRKLKKENINIDFMGASILQRAKETLALTNYDNFKKGDTLYELPYISEHTDYVPRSLQRSNQPLDQLKQNNLIKVKFGISAVEPKFMPSSINRNQITSNYKKFVNITLVDIINFLKSKNEKNNYTIFVVTHSMFMLNHIKCNNPSPNKSKPDNNQVYSVIYTYDSNIKNNKLQLKNISNCTPFLTPEIPNYFPTDGDNKSCELMSSQQHQAHLHPMLKEKSFDNWALENLSLGCRKLRP